MRCYTLYLLGTGGENDTRGENAPPPLKYSPGLLQNSGTSYRGHSKRGQPLNKGQVVIQYVCTYIRRAPRDHPEDKGEWPVKGSGQYIA